MELKLGVERFHGGVPGDHRDPFSLDWVGRMAGQRRAFDGASLSCGFSVVHTFSFSRPKNGITMTGDNGKTTTRLFNGENSRQDLKAESWDIAQSDGFELSVA